MIDNFAGPCLPWGTARIVSKHINQCKNLGLILDKYVPRYVIDDSKNKGSWLNQLASGSHVNPQLAQAAYQRWLAMVKALGITPFEATLDWRMVVGLGGESVLETDLTLHHLYGIPFIPGSALKGLTSAYLTQEKPDVFADRETKPSENRDPADQKAGSDPQSDTDRPDILRRIFGSQKQAGTVRFFDAVPVDGKFELVVDIMNPHYPDYYRSLQGDQIVPPRNDQSPIPVTFLAVKNARFAFALALRDPEHPKDLELVREWLPRALQDYGIGSKTSSGYGYFRAATDIEIKVEESAGTKVEALPIKAEPWQRPNIPRLTKDQEIQNCYIIQPTEEMRRDFPTASAFLTYKELPPAYVFIVIEGGTQHWPAKGTVNCIFSREERHGEQLVLFGRPKPPKPHKEKRKKS